MSNTPAIDIDSLLINKVISLTELCAALVAKVDVMDDNVKGVIANITAISNELIRVCLVQEKCPAVKEIGRLSNKLSELEQNIGILKNDVNRHDSNIVDINETIQRIDNNFIKINNLLDNVANDMTHNKKIHDDITIKLNELISYKTTIKHMVIISVGVIGVISTLLGIWKYLIQ